MSKVRFKAGETVICIINSRSSLTVGKEYKIKSTIIGHGGQTLNIVNDNGYEVAYDYIRFIPKYELRNKIINQIID